MKSFFVTLFLVSFITKLGLCINLRNSYIAAVVDHVHIMDDIPKQMIALNVEQYVTHIRNAARQYAKIIVFPEYGLVDIFTMYAAAAIEGVSLESYSSFVPDPSLKIVPCDDTKFKQYSMLVNISCEARYHDIYTVFNLPEKAINPDTKNLTYYNTNVVIDKTGAVIARHRKIHLSEEPFFEAGNELVTFTTDFNVTFGIFTCFDILFKYPAIDILNIEGVTDIIFTTAWYSETPFLQALSIQHGYAKRNGVNFLASGLQDPDNQDGGSGIYLADGTIAELYISSNKVSKTIVHEVPIIKSRTPAELCEYSIYSVMEKKKQNKYKKHEINSDIDYFPISRESLDNYTFESLQTGNHTLKKLCCKDKSFCCTFNITVERSNEEPDYTYKLAVYSGLSKYGSHYYGGIRACAVMACLNETDSTCGYKLSTTLNSFTLKSIYIEATLDVENNTYNQPTTLKQDLTPVEEYVYCEKEINQNTQTKIEMRTIAPQTSLITFGIYSRLYSLDMEPTSPPEEETKPLNTSLILLIMSVMVIILVFTGVILYKYCTKHD